MILKVVERRKRIINILKRAKSFRMGDHFSEIIKRVSFFFYLSIIYTPFRLPVILEKSHQRSIQTQQNDLCRIKCDPKSAEKLLSKLT